jgi:4-carboxymuconolactone decarboxylase
VKSFPTGWGTRRAQVLHDVAIALASLWQRYFGRRVARRRLESRRMRQPARNLIRLLLVIGTGAAAGQALTRLPQQPTPPAGGKSLQAPVGAFPKDIFPDTGNRFPAINRESLDEAGKRLYDTRGVTDAFGPGAIRLYSPPVADSMTAINEYLRRKSGLEPRLVELAILVTAREMDSEYVWTAHEPAAQKSGLAQEVIDAVKYRRPVTALGEKEAVIVQLGRDSIGKHKVGSDTFAHAQKLFGNQGLVNIVTLIGDYASTTILLNVADQRVRPSDKPLLPMP